MKYLSKIIILVLVVAGMSACSDLLDPETPQSKPLNSVNGVNDLKALINGAYSQLAAGTLYGRDYLLQADVRTSNAWSNGHSGRFNNIAMFNINANSSLPAGGSVWATSYSIIANCNIIINSGVKGSAAKPIIAQAYALRALSEMTMVKFYGQQFVSGGTSPGGVPYVTHFGDKKYFFPSRQSVKQVYSKVESDYKTALGMMDPNNSGKGSSAVKLDYYSVKALLARFYLYTGDYVDAASAAHDVMTSSGYSLMGPSGYVAAWAKDGEPNVLFEVAMTQTDALGSVSMYQMLTGDSYGDVEATKILYDLYSNADVRKQLLGKETSGYDDNNSRVDYRMAKKYLNQYKNIPVIRFSEMVLTYAEAKARPGPQQNITAALNALKSLTKHRYTNGFTYTTTNPTALLNDILKERRLEFAFEGEYYWQLLRNHQDIDRTMVRPGLSSESVHVDYGSFLLSFPIPKHEINANANVKQNKGF